MRSHSRARWLGLCGATCVLLITFQIEAGGAPKRRLLSMRGAERAIDLGFEAELAGDYRGALEALQSVARTATTSEEHAARERIERWVETIGAREEAFRVHGKTARGYHDAFRTLKGFGLERSTIFWTRALRDVPGLAEVHTASSAVRLRVELLRGPVDRPQTFRQVAAFLERHGVRAQGATGASARFEVRLDVDATDATILERGARVTVGASMLLRTLAPDRPARVVGSIAKHRSEERRNVVEARRSAVRRALEDAAEALLFLVREESLAETRGRSGVRG